jgi:hypothetical protein
MLTNRISRYLEDRDENTMTILPFSNDSANEPPANFAPVPPAMLAQLSQPQMNWQAELYRMAYQAALASVAAATTANRARWN